LEGGSVQDLHNGRDSQLKVVLRFTISEGEKLGTLPLEARNILALPLTKTTEYGVRSEKLLQWGRSKSKTL